MNEEILKKIKQLPPLPESVIEIEKVYNDPESTFNDMAKVLEKDPLLTADILKAANSPLYGFSREINAISQAVGLFGMGTVRGFVLSSVVKKSFILDLSPYGITNELFSELSKKQHALTTNWCKRKENRYLGVLSPASFLVEIGKVLIAQQIIADNKTEEFRNRLQELQDVEAVERELVGADTPEVSATIFQEWQFEDTLVDIIKNCQNPHLAQEENQRPASILHVVRVAIPMDTKITDSSIKAAKELIEKYALDMESFETAMQHIK